MYLVNQYFPVSRGLGSAFGKFTKFDYFFFLESLEYASMIGLTDISKLKKKTDKNQVPKPVR